MNSFYERISSVIEDLIVAIVGVGILVVSFEYVQFYLDFGEKINFTHLTQRLFLFLSVIFFTAYYFVAYSAYFSTVKQKVVGSKYGPKRIVIMFLLDLMAVTTCSWLFATLLLGTLTSAPDNITSNYESINLSISIVDLRAIFGIMFMWHTIILLWYFVALGDLKDKKLHFSYSLIYLGLFYVSDLFPSYFWIVYGFLGIYMILVLSMYILKGIPEIEQAIKDK